MRVTAAPVPRQSASAPSSRTMREVMLIALEGVKRCAAVAFT